MSIFQAIEIFGTIAFAISGALMGAKKSLDYFGVIVLAITTALGGGIIRDLLIGNTPPSAFYTPKYTIISIISGILVFHFYEKILKLNNIIQIFDALGLGAFTALGCSVAISNNYDSPYIIIVLALLTGTGGGIIRDVFVNEVPLIFQKEIYAVASIIGAIFFIFIHNIFPLNISMYTTMVLTLFIRLLAIKYDIHLITYKK